MKRSKALCTIGVLALLVSLSFTPVTAKHSDTICSDKQEENAVYDLFCTLEKAACESEDYDAFLSKIFSLFHENQDDGKFPVVKNILTRLLTWLLSQRGSLLSGKYLGNLFDSKGLSNRILSSMSTEHFVLSFGSYTRLNPRKENTIQLFKQGFSFWRYTPSSKLSQGRTLIIQRHPFEIKQRVTGSQIGIMTGFRGVYLDIVSKLTGNSYVFFMGKATRARAFSTFSLFSR
jgi:hypothetical protein